MRTIRWVIMTGLLATVAAAGGQVTPASRPVGKPFVNPYPAGEKLTDITPVAEVPKTQVMKERMGKWTFHVHGKTKAKHTGRFLEYTPRNWDGEKKLPMLIFLHGAGARTERGDTIDTLHKEFIPALIRKGKTFEAIVLCPQVKTYWGDQGAAFIDQALATYAGKVDPDRIYLTGLSSGGGGTWRAAALRHKVLAAAAPICGVKTSVANDAALKNLPIWAFHNRHDPYQSVEYTRGHVLAIRKAGGKYIHYTEYNAKPGKSHKGKNGESVFPGCHAHGWETAYGDKEMWDWLFRQRRGRPGLAFKGGWCGTGILMDITLLRCQVLNLEQLPQNALKIEAIRAKSRTPEKITNCNKMLEYLLDSTREIEKALPVNQEDKTQTVMAMDELLAVSMPQVRRAIAAIEILMNPKTTKTQRAAALKELKTLQNEVKKTRTLYDKLFPETRHPTSRPAASQPAAEVVEDEDAEEDAADMDNIKDGIMR